MDTNKNNDSNQKDMKTEFETISEKIISKLKKNYGYSSKQIIKGSKIQNKLLKSADLVVYDESKTPRIVIEIKTGNLALPLFEYQLKEKLEQTNIHFGILFNGKEIRTFQISRNNLIQIDDIPHKLDLEKTSKTQEILEKVRPLTLPEKQIWILKDILRGDFYDHKPLLQILTLKIIKESEQRKQILDKGEHFQIEFEKLIEKGIEKFPILFQNCDHLYEPTKTSIRRAIDLIDSYTLMNSNVKELSKIILKLSSRREWVDFPNEINNFVMELLEVKKDSKVFVPFSGSGNIFQIQDYFNEKILRQGGNNNEKEKTILGTEIIIEKFEILEIISLLRKIPIEIIVGDFLKLENKKITKNNFVIALPPPNQDVYRNKELKYEYGDYGNQAINYILLKIMKENKDANLAIFVPQGFLFSRSTKKIRQEILEKKYLRGIIQFPPGLLKPLTGIPICLLLLEFKTKNKTNSNVFFSKVTKKDNLNEKILNVISKNYKKFKNSKSFEENETNFIVNNEEIFEKWTINDKTPEMKKLLNIEKGVELVKLGDITFGKSIPIVNELFEEITEQNEVPFVRIQDIQDGLISNPVSKTVNISEIQKSRFSETRIEENDLLVSCQGTIGKIALARKIDFGHIPSPQIAIIRVNSKKVLPEYLFQALSSDIVQKQFQTLEGGMIPRINREDLRKIIIPLPSLIQQKKEIEKFRETKERIDKLENELISAKKNLLNFKSGT